MVGGRKGQIEQTQVLKHQDQMIQFIPLLVRILLMLNSLTIINSMKSLSIQNIIQK